MTMTIDELKAALTERKTAFVELELEPCGKCGCPVFYYRKGRKHNGCVACHLAKKDLANGSSLPAEASEVDENGVRVYEGRACKCGNKIRLGENAYGANAGKCRECAIHQQAEKEQGKELRRLSSQINSHAHKFTVDSITRSGAIEVAPSTLMEWLELKDLIQRCRIMNEQERVLSSGIHWEVCHVYPADPDGGVYRGKATVENLVIGQWEQNRRDGNKIPDEWTLKQVVSVADVRLIQRSFEAAKAWKERKSSWSTMTEQQKTEWQQQEQKAEREHKELVREITRGYCDSLSLVEQMTLTPLADLLEKAELQWLKIQRRMSNVIDAARQSGRQVSYVQAKGEKITLDAFHGAEARAWITYQTLQQVADAEMILREQGMTDEQEQQLSTVKRCAVLWAIDVNQNPRQLVMGFTHPLMNVLGDAYTWGTKPDEHGEQWICVWEPTTLQAIADQATPFDGEAPEQPELINSSLMVVPEPVKQFAGDRGWRGTDADYIYEQEKRKRTRAAAEQQQQRQEAAAAARREANKEKVGIRIASLKQWLSEDVARDLHGLYDFAGEMLPEALQGDAITLINEQFSKAAAYENELDQIAAVEYDTVEKAETELNNWQANNAYRIKQMCRGSTVFADLLNPF